MNPKKKIVHIIQSLDNGGCENMLLRTLPSLTDFEHVLICLHSEGALASKFKNKSLQVLCSRYNNFLDIPGFIRLIRILKKENPDLILTYLFHADVTGRILLPLFIRRNVPVIPFLRTTYNDSRYRIARFFEKHSRFLVNKYFANSEAVKTFYVQQLGISPERIFVIPNGIDTKLYDKSTLDTTIVYKELGLADTAFVITCVANFHLNKGHRYLLEAFIDLAQDYPEIHLLLVGDGPQKDTLIKQAEESSFAARIHFLGRRDDVKEILALSHLFVFPTFFEGLSNALQEAMASRLPIITTSIPENQILISHEENGLLVPSHSSASLTQAIHRVLTQPEFAQKIAFNAQETIKSYYSIETTNMLFTKILHETL
jgi:glycosyltransferase involved in cell wall biosynthesis